MSLGGPNCCAGNCPICSAVSELAKKGFIIVAAAGNSGKDLCCPGSSKEVMSVGAVCGEKLPTGFSSRGKTAFGRVVPDISSYGVIRFKNNKVHRGTSFSTPIVAGALSLCVSKSKFENYSDVSKLFQRTSEKAIPIKGEHGRSRLLNIKGCIKHRKFKLLSFKNYKQNSFRLLRPIILTTAATTALTALSWWYGFDKLGDVQQQEPTNSSVVLFGRVTSNNRRLYINDGSAIFPLHWAGRSGTRPRIGSISIIFGEITNGDYVSGQKRWTVPWL
jgi:hypothetical protein